MERYSRKREAILECLRSTVSHPTADWIYAQLKPVYPDLSLATVYRNLIQLKEAGLVRSMGMVAGQEHYDANVSGHPHAVCRSCGRIIDISGVELPHELVETVQAETGYVITGADLRFSGLCPECARDRGRE